MAWAKNSGLLNEALEYLEKNGGQYSSALASFLGDQIESGNVTASDIDNAGTSSALTGTTIATTAVNTQITTAATTATTLQQVRRAY